MFKKVSVQFHGREFSIEAGRIGKQASGAVWVRYGDTVALVTVVVADQPSPSGDFSPLTVNYMEKFYSAGKIPGGFFKRESRSSDHETLYCRLIDRPIRPLFPKYWCYETQIIPTVLSSDLASNPGVLALIGTSAALEVSRIPFDGPVAAVQVGRIQGEWIINPAHAQLEECEVDLVVAGNRQGITMVEGGAAMVPEEEVLEGIFLGYQSLLPLLDLQDELRQAVGVPKMEFESMQIPADLAARIETECRSKLESAWRTSGKMDRHQRLHEVRQPVKDQLIAEQVDLGPGGVYYEETMARLDREILRQMIIEKSERADGRGLDEVRPIECETGVLPRTHGSALFTRGETQALAVTTLGTRKDEKKIERLEDEFYKTFFLHYNFPPYSVGEIRGRLGPGRREIGHGNLAERALARVLPAHEDFPYTIRVVSEITESNGSSSMASVCGGSLSLMDAGVPLQAPVAGIAMGLVKEAEGKFHVLTDIMGNEDHCGDMDFKVAGTAVGVTAVQMDIKISGVDREIMGRALAQARTARLHVLDRMNAVLDRPRAELSPYAPRIVTIQIPVDKIRDVIGPGGKMIRAIVEETGAQIDVEDDGSVIIASPDMEANRRAIEKIKELTAEPEIGQVYTGKVVRIVDFGAFVEIMPNRDGLLHISRIDDHRIERVTDVLHEGDTVVVKCIGIDPDGKVSLSRKDVLELQPPGSRKPRSSDSGPPSESRPYSRDQRNDRPPRGGRDARPPRGSRPYDKDQRPQRRKSEDNDPNPDRS